ncbi:N-acyl homoserine lactonase family protein [Pseudomonas yamanorum]|uniref:N-acyl homoserine lactonase family protein n=1 Tax=Pseudomonas yamanorum TaxID=515393 RepID=A0A7Y8K691_9PSED|nr:N-acyl homoserine lactonase family protein [Pseudomonas yamanorum]NWE77803.1 N-acyl homoserine lactonase family protein [Pseudomonas yamanorum]
MIKLTSIQTGTVSIRPHHHCGTEGRGPIQRKIDMLMDKDWVEDLPIYSYLIEHPEGNFLIDTGDSADHAHKDYLPSWHPFFRHSVVVKVAPGEEVGDQLRARGLDPARDIKAVILTHMHHDHAGGLNHFPHTQIIVSKENFLLANSFIGKIFGCLPQHFPRWLAPTLIEFKNEAFGPFQQSYPLTKDKRILLVPTPGHMRGHMSVIVRTSDVTYFMAGDSTYDQNLLLEELVDGVTYDVDLSKRTLRQIMALGEMEPTVLLPAHDLLAGERLENTLCLPRTYDKKIVI